MQVRIGERDMEMGGPYLTELRASNDLLDNFDALRARLQEDGYLFIRGLHDRTNVLQARSQLLQRLSVMGKLHPDHPVEDGIAREDGKSGAFLGGLAEDLPALLAVVNAPTVMDFFSQLLGGPTLTYDYKWVRSVSPGEFTGAHYDVVYMGRGTKNVYTMWSPVDDVTYDLGGLALCLGSQNFDKIKQTYGQMDVDRDNVVGWFSNDPLEIVEQFGGRWATTSYRAGDALIFGMYVMHCSVTNTTNRVRFSVDTRYQLASEPVDERWFGPRLKGHYAWGQGDTVSMEDARQQWGV